jgi:MFS family permease
VKPAFRALEHRPFRVFFFGQGLSLVGTWMQTVAISWLIYRLSGSALLLGLTATMQQLPMLVLSPIAGVWAERLNRRIMLIVLQCIALVLALVLALLTFAGVVTVAQVIVLALAMGAVNAFEAPTRQAFLLDLVRTRQDLPNAIALQSMMFQAARFVGPSIAGVLLAAAGEGWCFLINAFSYLAVVIAYLSVRIGTHSKPRDSGDVWQQLKNGFSYAFGFIGTRRILVLLGFVSFFSMPWSTLMPIFAANAFAGDSRTLGYLISAVGLGAMTGTGFLAMRSSVRGLGRVVAYSAVLAGLALAAFSQTQVLWQGLALLAVFGFGLIVAVASSNTLLQTLADEDKRARVISMYVMVFLGIGPTGSLAAGALAERIGAPSTLLACGAVLTVIGIVFAAGLQRWSQAVRPIYVRLGIIEEKR